jgi:hypothetical protein
MSTLVPPVSSTSTVPTTTPTSVTPKTPKKQTIKLSKHKQWTGIDKGDIGRSGFAVGMGPKWNWYGMDLLTNRKIPAELQAELDYAESPGGNMNLVRAAQAKILSAGYTMADMGKEGVVAGGLSGMKWSADPGKLASWGWSQDANGQWRHSSWGDANIEFGDYSGSFDDYRKGLVDTQKEPEETPAEPVTEEAPVAVNPQATVPAPRNAAGVNKISRNPLQGPKRLWKDQKFGATGLA